MLCLLYTSFKSPARFRLSRPVPGASAGLRRTADQSAPAQSIEGANLQGKGQDRLRAGPQLLLLSRRHRRVSHRGDTVGDRLIQIQVFLLRDRHADSAGGAAGTVRVRFPVPLRVVSGADSQDSAAQKEAVHEEAQTAAVPQVPDPAADGDAAADLHKRGGTCLLYTSTQAQRQRGKQSSENVLPSSFHGGRSFLTAHPARRSDRRG